MFVVGLTGGIGSGKSTVAAMLVAKGAKLIDADKIARQVVEPGPVLDELVERFGAEILNPDRSLDRQKLANLAFASDEARADLNAITHPPIREALASQIAELADTDETVILDVPLMVESGRGGYEVLVVVDVDPELAIERLIELRGFSESDARARVAAQASREERLERADFVINNSGDLQALVPLVERCWDWITQRRQHA